MAGKTSHLLLINEFDEPRTRMAKMMLNCARMPPPRNRKQEKRLDELCNILEAEAASISADPRYRDDMMSEEVQIHIPVDCSQEWRDELQALLSISREKFLDELHASANPFLALLYGCLKDWHVAHSPPSLSSWSIYVSCFCDEFFSRRLCSLLHIEFSHELRRKEMSVRRWSIMPRFFDITCPHEAEDYLRKQMRKRFRRRKGEGKEE